MTSTEAQNPSQQSPGGSCLERGLEQLREGGYKLTRQRRAILELFDEVTGHFTPRQIYERLEPNLPSLSLATVYNTLELFEEQGIVTRLTARDGETYYEPNVQPHHHGVCNECGALFDMDVDEGSLRALSDASRTLDHEEGGFAIEEATVWFRGICQSCREES